MTPEAERLVRETYPQLEAERMAAAQIFYARLFELDPGARALFDGVDMDAQGAKFVAMLGSIIRSLGEAPSLVGQVAALGRRHAGYAVHAEHFESVGAALIWTIERVLGARCTPEVRHAWGEAYALVAALMRRAAERSTDEHRAAARAPA
jgi:hemoglobin-like flavoprotein